MNKAGTISHALHPVLAEDVRARLEAISGIEETEVEIVFDPPWNPNMMTDAARLQLGFM